MIDNAFPEYHKIQGVYKRDGKGNFILGNYSTDVFRFLENLAWHWTEKIDGTNIRIAIDPKVEKTGLALEGIEQYVPVGAPVIRIGGHHANSQIPVLLYDTVFNALDDDRIQSTFQCPVVLYGEGYGGSIQKGHSHYGYPEAPAFILYDVWVEEHHNPLGGYWLSFDKVQGISDALNIKAVPELQVMSLLYAIQTIRWHPPLSQVGVNLAEGIVGTPTVPLFDRQGHRIITKIKYRDFLFCREQEDTGGYL
jgi:hypothetical protein